MLKIYTKPNCPNCDIAKAKALLGGHSYIEINLNTPEALAEFKAQYPSVRAVPYVLSDSGVIGGLTAFKAWLKEQK